MNIGEGLTRNAQHFPKKLALRDHAKSITYRDLHLRTNRLGNYLLAHGVRPGDLVAFSCGSRSENFELLFAIGKIGAVAVPFDFHWSAQECRAMIDFLEPNAFVVEGRQETRHLAGILPDRFRRRGPSPSTGRMPGGVIHTRRRSAQRPPTILRST